MLKKPLIRWVVGKVHDHGYNCLNKSVKLFKMIYGDIFRTCLMYNQIESIDLNKIKIDNFDCVINQSNYMESLSICPPKFYNPCWKLYPPRLDIDTHEIIIDNDIVIFSKIKQIGDFLLSKNSFLLTEAYKRSYCGEFENLIKKDFNVNSGLIGMPPGFDFASEIEKKLKNFGGWSDHFDEQSIVASIFQNLQVNVIKKDQISVEVKENIIKGQNGSHFVGLNNGYEEKFLNFSRKNKFWI